MRLLLLAIALLPFALGLPDALTRDLWYDELWGLDHSVFVDWGRVLFEWQTPNQHVFWHVCCKLWLDLLGVHSTVEVLSAPWKLRILPVLFSLGALAYVYRAATLLAGSRLALVALAFAAGSLPFLHFATQARGYSLSLLALCACLAHGVRHLQTGRLRDAIVVGLSVALALWTTPANGYVLLGLVTPLGVLAQRRCRARKLLAASFGGLALALLVMAPILPAIASYPGLASRGPFRWATVTETMPAVFVGFAMAAPWLAIVVLLACRAPAVRGTIGLLACALVAPFVASFVRGDVPFQRVFFGLLPVVAMLIAVALRPLACRRSARVAGIAVVVLVGGALLAIRMRDQRIRLANTAGRVRQGLTDAYYIVGYAPSARIDSVARRALPLFVGVYDVYALPTYAQARGVDARPLRELLAGAGATPASHALVLGRGSAPLLRELAAAGFATKLLSKPWAVHALIEVNRERSVARPR